MVTNDKEMEDGIDRGSQDDSVCPCSKWIKKAVWVECEDCHTWWHTGCVGLFGLTEAMVDSIKKYSCPRCFTSPWVIPVNSSSSSESSGTSTGSPGTCSTVTTALKSEFIAMYPVMKSYIEGAVQATFKAEQVGQVVEEANKQITKSWAEIASGKQKQLITDVVKLSSQAALTESMQLVDASLSQQKKRSMNVIISGLPETSENPSKEELVDDFVGLMEGEIEKRDVLMARRLGAYSTEKKTARGDVAVRNVLLTLRYDGDALYAHNTGNGRKIVLDSGKAVWINPDLTRLERDARLKTRQEKQKKYEEDKRKSATVTPPAAGTSSENASKNV